MLQISADAKPRRYREVVEYLQTRFSFEAGSKVSLCGSVEVAADIGNFSAILHAVGDETVSAQTNEKMPAERIGIPIGEPELAEDTPSSARVLLVMV